MNNKCTVSDSPRYHVLLEIDMYMVLTVPEFREIAGKLSICFPVPGKNQYVCINANPK